MKEVKSATEIYKEVLSGKRKRFPINFWVYNGNLNYSDAKEITIYMIENILNWSEDEVKKNLTTKTFEDNKLIGMLEIVFNRSTFKALNNAYPDKFHEWELSTVPRNYWNLETAKKSTKWLIEEKLKWDEVQVKKELEWKVFNDNGLVGMLGIVFNGSVYKALNNAYPNKFHEWELSSVPNDYWNLETAKKATKWLIEEKLKWTKEEAKEKLNEKVFKENGLYSMLLKVFNGDIDKALKNVYEGVEK